MHLSSLVIKDRVTGETLLPLTNQTTPIVRTNCIGRIDKCITHNETIKNIRETTRNI